MTKLWQTIGFGKNKKLFEHAIEGGILGHAYLFAGPEMIGKRTFALEIAGIVTNRSAPDIFTVSTEGSDSGQTITIEDVRKIKNYVSLSPYTGQYKFVIIDDAHSMTIEAQSSLLKILEEPSDSSILILITAHPDALMSTIASRCQEIEFSAHGREEMEIALTAAKLSKTNKEFLADFADGRIGLIKRIIDENSFEEIEEAVKKIMHLAKADITERLNVAQKLTDDKNKAKLPLLIFYWTLYLRTRLNEPKAQKMLRGLMVLNEIVNKPQYNQRLALENFLIQM